METPYRHCNVQRHDQVGMEDKLFAVTLDNANNNGAMMKLLKTHLLTKQMLLSSGRFFRQHCVAHVINMICQAILLFLSPMISKILTL